MKCHIYYSQFAATALFCLFGTNSLCFAADSNPYASAGIGSGVNGQLYHGNTNVPFDSWNGLSNNSPSSFDKDINPTTSDPYDELPIHQSNNVNDNSGQQIYDYGASNGRSLSSSGAVGTYKQTPIGRTSVNPATGMPGLQPTTTALQAGAVPGIPGAYSFTQVPFEKGYNYSYGFNTNPVSTVYTGLTHANYNTPSNNPYGGMLPPTSTGAVDINTVNGSGLKLGAPAASAQSFLSFP